MLTEIETRRNTALEPLGPGQRTEALLGLLLVPVVLLVGFLVGLWRLVKRSRPLAEHPARHVEPGARRLDDVAEFAERVEAEDASPRIGFGSMDFELAYARDLIPSTLDMYPALANRYYSCPPPFERVTFESFDGTPLAAEVAIRDDRPRPGLVVVHGTFGSSGQGIYAAPAIRAFVDWGFNVAVVDLRGWGRSSALSTVPMSGGWREAEDVLAAARYLLERSRTTTVGAMGYSLGGAAVLLAAAHERAPELLRGGVFSESGYVDARDVVKIVERNPGILTREYIVYWLFKLGLGRKLSIQGYRGMTIVDYFETVAAPYYGVAPEELYRRDSVIHSVGDIRVPTFQLHAVDDWIVKVDHAVRLRDEAARTGNRLVGVCIRRRGAHCAFDRVIPAWRERVAREFFASTSGVALVEAA